jgi:hypothetical protein
MGLKASRGKSVQPVDAQHRHRLNPVGLRPVNQLQLLALLGVGFGGILWEFTLGMVAAGLRLIYVISPFTSFKNSVHSIKRFNLSQLATIPYMMR